MMNRNKVIHCLLALWFSFSAAFLYAQKGHLVIVGGGTEYNDTEDTWNHAAYQWSVEHSGNKKVAILHYSSGSSWLEDYFVNHCGASEALSFIIGAADANNSSLMTELEEYDMFFLRGGNQWRYYDYWRGTLIHDLLEQKFSDGAVLSGTSAGLAVLSGVVYTAENVSAYSDASVKNIDDPSHTLENDLFSYAPGFLFDSHFTDRGRMGRLVAFMAKWKKDKGEDIVGIGVDESTAFAIHSSGMAYAFGTGAVNIFRTSQGNDFGPGPMISIDSLILTQLLHGDSINLNDFSIYGQEDHAAIDFHEGWVEQTIYLSGSENLSSVNQEILSEILSSGEGATEALVILTGNDTDRAESYKTYLQNQGATNVSIIRALYSEIDNSDYQTKLQDAGKFIFIDNNAFNLNGFLNGGGNGNLLSNKIKQRISVLFFVGDNARFAGNTVVTNYSTPNASENHSFTLSEGIGRLDKAVIIPHTFLMNDGGGSITDIWHSTFSALPYAMISEELPLGIWLNHENAVKIYPENESARLKTYGTSPVMTLFWYGGKAALASQGFKGLTGEKPRQIAGFHTAFLSFLLPGTNTRLGSLRVDSPSSILKPGILLWPNPAGNTVYLNVPDRSILEIFSIDGRIKDRVTLEAGHSSLPVGKYSHGLYIFRLNAIDAAYSISEKIIIHSGL